MEERLNDIEKDVQNLGSDVKLIQNEVENLKKNDDKKTEVIQDLRESIVELNALLGSIRTAGKWFLGIVSGITVTVIGALIFALIKLI